MRHARAFGRFWWSFVIGDDWRLAVGGGAALAFTAVAAHTNVTAWWIAPVAVIALLGGTLARARPHNHR